MGAPEPYEWFKRGIESKECYTASEKQRELSAHEIPQLITNTSLRAPINTKYGKIKAGLAGVHSRDTVGVSSPNQLCWHKTASRCAREAERKPETVS